MLDGIDRGPGVLDGPHIRMLQQRSQMRQRVGSQRVRDEAAGAMPDQRPAVSQGRDAELECGLAGPRETQRVEDERNPGFGSPRVRVVLEKVRNDRLA